MSSSSLLKGIDTMVAVVVDVAVALEEDMVEATQEMQQHPQLKIVGSFPPWVASEISACLAWLHWFPFVGFLCIVVKSFESKVISKEFYFLN